MRIGDIVKCNFRGGGYLVGVVTKLEGRKVWVRDTYFGNYHNNGYFERPNNEGIEVISYG